jgi:hypothetical protein
MPARVRGQLAFDEKAVEDAALESALEERQRRKEAMDAVRLTYKEAHEAAQAEIARLDLGDGTAVRVGRFRITREYVAARSVQFDAASTSRTRILLADEAE